MKASPQDQLSTLIGEIYDLALSSDRWSALLGSLSDTLGKAGVALFVRELQAEEVPEPSDEDMGSGFTEASEKFHLSIKVHASGQAAEANAAEDGAGASGADLPGAPGQPLARPEAIILGCFISRDKPTGSLVGIQRAAKPDPAAPWDAAFLRRLAPHLRRAFDLHKQFLTMNVQRAAANRVLDHIPIGVLLVDARGRVLTMNSCAEAMVAQADGLAVDRGGVRADSGQETTALRSLIKAAAESGNGEAQGAGGAMTLSRPSLRRPFWALVAPLRSNRAEEEGLPAVVALFVSDPERRHQIPAQVLDRFFGLTPAETRLLEALVNGMSLEDAAEQFQLSKNTLRTQLHQVFRKTRTKRQSEVVKLVLSAPVQMDRVTEEAE